MKNQRITALLTVLAMLVAPLCAPFCPAHACAVSSLAQNEDCHGTAIANADGFKTGIKAVHICGVQELPTAALNEKNNSFEFVKQQHAMPIALNFFASPSPLLAVSSAQFSPPDCESAVEAPCIQPTVLRI